DRARRTGAGRRPRRDRYRAPLRRVADPGARGAAATGGERSGRGPRPSRRRRGAALARAPDRHVRGDGGTGGPVRGARGGADDGDRAAEARGNPRRIAGIESCRQSGTLPRSQRALSQRDLCRFAQHLHRRNDAGDAGAGAAVPPGPVPQSRPAGEVAGRARSRRGRDPA
ncbi:hypothetical protein OY671_010906, partial [Metschnikowia pulcherrima]